ncbi:MAG: hypothetical protein GC154_14025 [bacterium]|nr:hypothetical protein [bacterium]
MIGIWFARKRALIPFCVAVPLVFATLAWSAEPKASMPAPPAIGDESPLATASASAVEHASDASFARHAVDQTLAAIQNAMKGGGASPTLGGDPSPQLISQTEGQSTAQMIGRMLVSLALVISLGLTLAWAAKKFVIKKHTLGGGRIELLGSYAVSAKSKVHLIRVGREHFLVGEGGNALTLISAVDAPDGAGAHELPEYEPAPPIYDDAQEVTPFQDRLSEWKDRLEGRNLSDEVKTHLMMLQGLSQRLKSKGGENDG